MKLISVILLTFLFAESYSQNSWDEYLVFQKYYSWDSVKCNQYYISRDSRRGFGGPEKQIEIKGGFETIFKNLEAPKVPSPFEVGGEVWLRFVISKVDSVECLRVYSQMPEIYIKSVLESFNKLNFEAAQNSGKKIDYEFYIPYRFFNNYQVKGAKKKHKP